MKTRYRWLNATDDELRAAVTGLADSEDRHGSAHPPPGLMRALSERFAGLGEWPPGVPPAAAGDDGPLTDEWLGQFAQKQRLGGGFVFVRNDEWRPIIGEQCLVVAASREGAVTIEAIQADRDGKNERRGRYTIHDKFTRNRFRRLCESLGIVLWNGK